MKRAHQKRQTLRRFLLVAVTSIATSICLCLHSSALVQTIGVSLYDPVRFWDFKSSLLTAYSLDLVNVKPTFNYAESDEYFFPQVPRRVMEQCTQTADFYYNVPFKTVYTTAQYFFNSGVTGRKLGEVYFNIPIEDSYILPLQTFQIWVRVRDCSIVDPATIQVYDRITYIDTVQYGAIKFESKTVKTDASGNQWQCFEYFNDSGATTTIGGLTFIMKSTNRNTIPPYGAIQIDFELGPTLLGFVSDDLNVSQTQQYWDDAYFLGIENDIDQLESLYADRVLGSDPEYDSPYDDLEIPEYNVDQIIKEDEALDQADEDLDKFLDDVSGSDVQNCVDFFQYVFGKIAGFGEVAVFTGGTIVVSIFRAVMGR